jgi:hypothetical protein
MCGTKGLKRLAGSVFVKGQVSILDLLVFGLKAENRRICHTNITRCNEAQKKWKTASGELDG